MDEENNVEFMEVHEVKIQKLGSIPIAKGDFNRLPLKVQKFVISWVAKTTPRALYICDGSQAEAEEIIHKLIERGVLTKLKKYEEW